MHQIITLYTVYLCNLTCELYLNNAGKNPWSKHTIMDQGGDWIEDLLPGGMLTLKAKCSLYPKVKFVQSCPTLCNPMDYTDHGVLQARILERVAFSFSRGSSQPRDRTQVSSIVNGVFTVWAIREAQYPKKHCGIVVVFCTCPWLGTYCSLSGSYQWPYSLADHALFNRRVASIWSLFYASVTSWILGKHVLTPQLMANSGYSTAASALCKLWSSAVSQGSLDQWEVDFS